MVYVRCDEDKVKPGAVWPGVWEDLINIVRRNKKAGGHEFFKTLRRGGFIDDEGLLVRSWFMDGSSNSVYVVDGDFDYRYYGIVDSIKDRLKSQETLYHGLYADDFDRKSVRKTIISLYKRVLVFDEGVDCYGRKVLVDSRREHEFLGALHDIKRRSKLELSESRDYMRGKISSALGLYDSSMKRAREDIVSIQMEQLKQLTDENIMRAKESMILMNNQLDLLVEDFRRLNNASSESDFGYRQWMHSRSQVTFDMKTRRFLGT